jgi:hypothetical protein
MQNRRDFSDDDCCGGRAVGDRHRAKGNYKPVCRNISGTSLAGCGLAIERIRTQKLEIAKYLKTEASTQQIA